jgi:hypothetical protein
MTVAIRHAWLQKHPSPVASAGEFHWYPHEGDRELRGSCVERMRGIDPPAVLWELTRGRVVWAQPFAAIAPHDGRRYVGLVLTIVERQGASPAELLDALVAPGAGPFVDASSQPAARRASIALAGYSSLDITLDPKPDEAVEARAGDVDVAGVARALLSGGTARVADPGDPALAAWIGTIERWMPEAVVASPRRGVWTRDESIDARRPPPPELAGSANRAGSTSSADRVAELVAGAWRAPTSSAARAWRLLAELAETRGQTVDEVERELAGLEQVPLGVLSDEERAVLPGKSSLVDALHAWGRGQLDQCPTAGTLTARLADAVALRVLARLVDGRDARAVIAEARWYALLPAARRATLLEAVADRAVSLRGLVEVTHA